MANAVAARLKGDEYQHLFAWLHALELLMPQRQVSKVIIEDAKALSADDVTLLRTDAAHAPDLYHQIKYHVDQRDGYSVEALTACEKGESSLLKKWYRSWETLLTNRPARRVEIVIVSNWGWVAGDDLAGFVDGQTSGLKEEFFTATGKQKGAAIRKGLAAHVGATVPRFDEFARSLHFCFGYSCWVQMAAHAAERMEHHNLKHDENALILAVGIVRGWVMGGRQEITAEDLKASIAARDLWLPAEAKPSVNIYLTTIKEQKFDVSPDYLIDWRPHFLGSPAVRGHDLIDPAGWNTKLLPELHSMAERVSKETNKRLVRARGLARLSAWFAFGSVFSDVSGFTIEVDQQGQLWQSDAHPSTDFLLTSDTPAGEALDPDGETVAVAISITGNVEDDVRRHLQHRREKVKRVLFVRPNRDMNRHCVRDAGAAVALADGAKLMMREFVKRHEARRLLLYYLGPLSGACFIGHRLNAVCREVQIMEWSDPDYMPSFTLT
jgi:hypothetical protein